MVMWKTRVQLLGLVAEPCVGLDEGLAMMEDYKQPLGKKSNKTPGSCYHDILLVHLILLSEMT